MILSRLFRSKRVEPVDMPPAKPEYYMGCCFCLDVADHHEVQARVSSMDCNRRVLVTEKKVTERTQILVEESRKELYARIARDHLLIDEENGALVRKITAAKVHIRRAEDQRAETVRLHTQILDSAAHSRDRPAIRRVAFVPAGPV